MPARKLEPTRPPGRPMKIDDVCREAPVRDADGEVVGMRQLTVADSILADIATGMPKTSAVQRTGITMQTFYNWERQGMALRLHPPLDPVTRKPRRLTRPEHRLVEFSLDLHKAEAEGHGRYFGAQANSALRSSSTTETTTVTEKDKDGNIVATRTTEKVIVKPPDPHSQRFILAHRYRDDWGDSVEVTGVPPVASPDAVAASILDKLRAIQSGAPAAELSPAPIDVDADEVPPTNGKGH